MNCQLRACLLSGCAFALFSVSLPAQNNQNNNFQRLPPATTVQQPTFGVSINAQGILAAKMFAGPGHRHLLQRNVLANPKLNQDVNRYSASRKISLKRLAEHLSRQLDQQQTIDEVAAKLAGLTKIHTVVTLPADKDILIVGNAEGWFEDASSRCLGAKTGAPTILLEDLLTALHQFHPTTPRGNWVGCSIEPKPQALAELKKFNQTIPKSVSQSAKARVVRNVIQGTARTLGNADIKVFGISPKTHMSRVLVEADYRMKLIAVGVERPPIAMPSFYQRVQLPPRSAFQRWWFVPSADQVKVSADNLSVHLSGEKVDLLTEAYATTKSGQLFHTGKQPSGPAKAFADQFSRDFAKIAQASPVFAQMKNMIDLLVAAAFLQQSNAFQQTELNDSGLFAHGSSLIETGLEPKEVACVANGGWKGNQMIAVAGGGVSIDAGALLEKAELLRDETETSIHLPKEAKRWWWD